MDSMPEGQGDRRTNRVGLSEGILLAVSSALAYFLAYRFEAGYLDWFRIPSDLIQLSLDHVVFTWSILLLAAFTMLAILGELPARPWHALVTRVLTFIFTGASLWFTLLVARLSHGGERVVFIVFAILLGVGNILLLFFEVIVPLLARPRPGPAPGEPLTRDSPWLTERANWLERMAIFDRVSMAVRPRRVKDWLYDSVPNILWIWSIAAIFGLGMALAGRLGAGVAKYSSRYLVAAGPPECAVIRRYGEHLLCLEIRRSEHRFGRKLRLISEDGTGGELLSLEDLWLGPPIVGESYNADSQSQRLTKWF